MASSFFNPKDAPLNKVDTHLPQVAQVNLRAETLRARFRTPPVWTPELAVERQFEVRAPARASVLIPLVSRGDEQELMVLLTRRTDHLRDHPGQISFPGGRSEPTDANEISTALREAQEEIGLRSDFVEVLGSLPLYTTGTGFIVTPVVALVRQGFSLKIDAEEVAEVFEVPLSFLMNPVNHRWHSVEMGGLERRFLSMHWQANAVSGVAQDYLVWGATAAMLRNLYRFLLA